MNKDGSTGSRQKLRVQRHISCAFTKECISLSANYCGTPVTLMASFFKVAFQSEIDSRTSVRDGLLRKTLKRFFSTYLFCFKFNSNGAFCSDVMICFNAAVCNSSLWCLLHSPPFILFLYLLNCH